MTSNKFFLPCISAVLLLSACSGSQSSSPDKPVTVDHPASLADAPTRPAARAPEQASLTIADKDWSLSYTARCEGGAPEACPGFHRFSLSSDGTYLVGPGPQGQMLSGWLAADDRNALRNVLAKLKPGAVSSGRKCENSGKGLRDALEATVPGWEPKRELLGSSEDSLCFDVSALGSEAEASALRDSIRGLVRKYSPEAFPNPCVDAVQGLDHNYDIARSCTTDAECAYVDENFSAIEPGDMSAVVVDDCTFVKPMAVANVFTLMTAQRGLIEQRESVRAACGAQLQRQSCQRSIELRSVVSPVCVNNRCRVPGKVRVF